MTNGLTANGHRRELRPLVIAVFAGLLALFAILGVLAAAARIESSVTSLTDNAAASLAALDRAQGELRSIGGMLDDVASGRNGRAEAAPELLQGARSRLRAAMAEYREQPVFAGETAMWPALDASLADLDVVVEAVLRAPRGAARPDLAMAARQAVGRASTEMTRLTELNAGQMPRLRAELELVRGQLLPAAAATALVCAIAALVAVFVGRRMVERALSEAERSRDLLSERATELEAFAGRIAHDLLSPLTTVAVALGVAERGASADARSAEILRRGGASLRRARCLVDGLLSFARAGARPEPGASAEVRAVVEDVVAGVSDLAAEARATVTTEGQPEVFVACSAGALTSIVGNLVQNALKFVTTEERREVRIRWAEVDRVVCIEVQDSGPGVAPELRDAVFEPFVRAGGAKPGVGLGLATVKKLCQGHGGSVGVRSAPGGGATFAVVLPCGEPPAARAGAPGDGEAPVRPAAPALH